MPTFALSQDARQSASAKSCAINVAHVSGNVEIKCPGIPPEVLKPLIRLLDRENASEQQAREQTESWRTKYEDLLQSTASSGLSEASREKAIKLLEVGDLDGAARLFDQAQEQQQPIVVQAANTAFSRGLIAQLQLDIPTALKNYGKAHALLPENVLVAMSYGNLLILTGDYARAADVFEPLSRAKVLPGGDLTLAATLVNAGSAYKQVGRTSDAKDAFAKAAILFDQARGPDTLGNKRNEAIALMAVASIKLAEGSTEQACAGMANAIELMRKNLGPGNLGVDQLASTLDEYASCSEQAGMKQQAIASITESVALRERPDQPPAALGQDPSIAAKIGLAGALTTECAIFAQNGRLADAVNIAKKEVAIIEPMVVHGFEAYGPKLGRAYFDLGVTSFMAQDYTTSASALEQSVSAYRKSQENGRTDHLTEFAMALNYLAVVHARENSDTAPSEAQESMTVWSKIALTNAGVLTEFQQCTNNAISVLQSFGKGSEGDALENQSERRIQASVMQGSHN